MKFTENKMSGLFRRRKSKSKSPSVKTERVGSPCFDSGSSGSLSSKSPAETPKSVLCMSSTPSTLKKSSSAITTATEIAVLGEPSASSSMVIRSSSRTMEDELCETFKVFDADGDGRITAAELGFVLRSLGESPTEDELASMVQAADKDGDGFIDVQEFIALNISSKGGGKDADDDLLDAFHIFDTDRNGLISAEELHRVLRSLGDSLCTVEECRRMISSVDQDGDGFVDFHEFRRMMTC